MKGWWATSRCVEAPVAVVGSGIAGLFCALHLAEGGHDVLVLTKRNIEDSSTNWAQGGIAAILDRTAEEAIEAHVQDTLDAGDGACNEDVVRSVVLEAGARITDLLELGVRFQEDGAGGWHLVQEGGHSARRILHAKDATGREIERALVAATEAHPRITVESDAVVIDLIRRDHPHPERGVVGLWVQGEGDGKVRTVRTAAVVLATGGAGRLWEPTTNPPVSTGDGLAMAHRFGAAVRDLAFVQFHPTTVAHPQRTLLITEALRGEGAVLLDDEGLAAWKEEGGDPARFSFTLNASPLGSLATRDIVARAIDARLKKTGQTHVWLVTSHLDADTLQERFPYVQSMLNDLGLTLGEDPLPVQPAAHYTVGGVQVDGHGRALSTEGKVLPGLFAVGEVASTGMHGANRLASNSLLEAVVFAKRAADAILAGVDPVAATDIPAWRSDGLSLLEEHGALAHDLQTLRSTMGREVGIQRSHRRLARAKRRLDLLEHEVEATWRRCKPTRDLVELRNMVLVGRLVVDDALARTENRGLHYNADLV